MKLLNLTAALFLGGVLQAQNPLPAIHPQPQEVTLSTNRLKAPHGFTLSGMQHPDEDAMRLIRQTLSITDNSEALPLKITSLEDRTPELKRSGAYLLVITPEEIDIAISDSRGLFYAAQTLQQLAQTDGQGNTTLPLGVIKDYPDVAYRGTVEGSLEPYRPHRAASFLWKDEDEHLYLRTERRSLPQFPKLAQALSGKGSSTDQGSREGSRRQQGRLRLGDPSGPGH